MDTHTLFTKLREEITVASAEARAYFDSDDFSSEAKADGSAVTAVDQAVEKRLRAFITTHFPDDAVVGEEEDATTGTSGYVWHIDPIDGTDNFLRKIPFCAISVARLGDTAEGTFAIVHNPITNHTFASVHEDGAYENERLTSCTAEPLGGKYLISTAIRAAEPWMQPARFNLQREMTKQFGKCHSYSCCALELAYVAAGRIDAFFSAGLHSWDYAAGLYLVKAAGGVISVYENDKWQSWERSIKELCDCHGRIMFVSHPAVHRQMRDFVGDPRTWGQT